MKLLYPELTGLGYWQYNLAQNTAFFYKIHISPDFHIFTEHKSHIFNKAREVSRLLKFLSCKKRL